MAIADLKYQLAEVPILPLHTGTGWLEVIECLALVPVNAATCCCLLHQSDWLGRSNWSHQAAVAGLEFFVVVLPILLVVMTELTLLVAKGSLLLGLLLQAATPSRASAGSEKATDLGVLLYPYPR